MKSEKEIEEIFENELIDLQEEATTKWNSEEDRKKYALVYKRVDKLREKLGVRLIK